MTVRLAATAALVIALLTIAGSSSPIGGNRAVADSPGDLAGLSERVEQAKAATRSNPGPEAVKALEQAREAYRAALAAYPGPDQPRAIVRTETEPNNLPGAANLINIADRYTTIAGSIAPDVDVDYYRFSAPAGSRLWAYVDTGCSTTTTDSLLTLYAADGTTTIEYDDEDGTGNCQRGTIRSTIASVIAGRDLTAGGTYFLRVEHATSSGSVTSYSLYIAVTPPVAAVESRPNDSSATAEELPISGLVGVIGGVIETPGDVDVYRVAVTGGTAIYVALDEDPEKDGASLKGKLQLIGMDGATLLLSTNDDFPDPPAAEGFAFAIATTGTYYIRIAGSSGSDTGRYALIVAGDFGLDKLQQADLAVAASAASGVALPGGTIDYRVSVTNNGPNAATSVSLVDTLPTNATLSSFTGAAGWTCSPPPIGGTGSITCTTASVASKATAIFSLAVSTSPTTAEWTQISNVASIRSDHPDSTPGNNSASADVRVQTADLRLSKTASSSTSTAGTNLTYTIVATNGGPSAAYNVTLSDPLPANTSFVSLAAPSGWNCATPSVGGAGSVVCTNPLFRTFAGAQTFTLVVKVSSGAAADATIVNTASVSSANDPNAANNSAAVSVTVASSADLSLTAAASPDPAPAGEPLRYLLTVQNNGPSDARSVSLTDILPAGTTFLSLSSPSGWTCLTPPVGGMGSATCTIATLAAASGPREFTLSVSVDAAMAAGTTITNSATVGSATSDPTPANNGTTTTVIAAAAPGADLSVTKTDSPDPVGAKATLSYRLTVTNHGPGSASNVALTDAVPVGTTFQSLTAPAGWTCTTPALGGSGAIRCSRPSLTVAQGGQTFTLRVLVGNAVANNTVIMGTATVAASTTDPTPANNSATANTRVCIAGSPCLGPVALAPPGAINRLHRDAGPPAAA